MGAVCAPCWLVARWSCRWRRRSLLAFAKSCNTQLTCFSIQARAAAPVAASIRGYADKASPTEVSSILEQRIRGVQEESGLAETGRVLSVGYVFDSRNTITQDARELTSNQQ